MSTQPASTASATHSKNSPRSQEGTRRTRFRQDATSARMPAGNDFLSLETADCKTCAPRRVKNDFDKSYRDLQRQIDDLNRQVSILSRIIRANGTPERITRNALDALADVP